jgi:hypothetical protein
MSPEVANAYRVVADLQRKIRKAECTANTSKDEFFLGLAENSLPKLRIRLQEAEAEVTRILQCNPEPAQSARTHVEVAALGPEYQTNEQLDIPPFLRRSRSP